MHAAELTDGAIPYDRVRAVEWKGDHLSLIDQRRLPTEHRYLNIKTASDAAQAIMDMVVRGAPAIGITAAYAVVLAARECFRQTGDGWQAALEPQLQALNASRPTAVNLRWAIERMRQKLRSLPAGDPVPALLAEAKRIHADDIAANHRMGELGASLLGPGSGVLTHCNTGALATGGYGTALGVIRAGCAAGRIKSVYADETRPWLQGARLTAWELQQEGIPSTLIADGAAATLMKQDRVQWLIVGSDRIAANGDVANKIGTYHAAIAARYHGVKVMVVAPTSTVDLSTATGDAIPIEERPEKEVLTAGGMQISPQDAHAWNPAFDVTPAELVDYIVTEKGIVESPTAAKIRAMMAV